MIIDLSHTIRAGLTTYPGLPAPTITPYLTREDSRGIYAPGTEFAMDIITMIGNTGTYLDSPFHRYGDGGDLASLELETLVDLSAVVVHRRGAGERAIDVDDLPDAIEPGSAVLFDTGWDRHFGTDAYGQGAPYVTAAAAQELARRGVALVGIDSVNIDDTSASTGGERPTHSILLHHGIHVVEHLTNLAAVPERGALFTAAPPRIEGFGTFPVRAFATVGAGSVDATVARGTKELPSGGSYRAVFDAEVSFSNEGGLQVQGFRIDVPGPDVGEEEIGRLFVASLDLLMTRSVTIRGVRIIEEAHKGTRGGPSDPRKARVV